MSTDAMRAARPCPFCGSSDIGVYEGDTFRWRLARCNCCGAQAGDVRIQTAGSGTRDEWEANAVAGALAEWNKRTASAERVPLTDEAVPVAADARGMLEFLSARFKHAGLSEAVAESYARDIDAILSADAKPARVPLTYEQIVALAKQSDGYELRGDYPRMIGFCPGPLVRFARAIERAHGIGEPK